MNEHPSESAGLVAGARALISMAPKYERFIEDPYAHHFITGRFARLAKGLVFVKKAKLDKFLYPLITAYSNIIVGNSKGPVLVALRHKFIDDKIKKYVEHGAKQVILLGAGFDTRAYRLGLKDIDFIEIDHPSTQQEKLKRLCKIKNLAEARVSHCPIDFQKDWLQQIRAHNIIRNVKSVVVWEGVTMYLTEEAIDNTFKTIKCLCPLGVNVLFDVMDQKFIGTAIAEKTLNNVISPNNEPFTWGCTDENLHKLLESNGFSVIENLHVNDYGKIIGERDNFRIHDLKKWPMLLIDACCGTG